MAKSLFEEVGGRYERQGDYLIPRHTLPDEKEISISVWGQWHLRYLKECRRGTYINLLTSGKIDNMATECKNSVVAFLKKISKYILTIFYVTHIITHRQLSM